MNNISTERKRSIRNAGVSERSHYVSNRVEELFKLYDNIILLNSSHELIYC
ncbi:MAG: hypothetical protein O4860_10095 [Trichodesmium sp. St2_bin2_1]|nr:hypothetical protein [Trichodesmium sp. St2_bin2_1]